MSPLGEVFGMRCIAGVFFVLLIFSLAMLLIGFAGIGFAAHRRRLISTTRKLTT
jgi:hypothetical protein